ncbi:MAG: YraN family protein [Anaerolineae bacterium]
MAHRKQRTGRRGEDLAVDYLRRQGYEIVVRNWRCRAGEMDIVARQGQMLVFVEVRARRSRRLGTPEESITPAKQARLIEVAQSYLQETGSEAAPWRIDVVAVLLDERGQAARLNHIEYAVGEG